MYVATLLNLPRKKGATMQKANISHGKTKMDKMVRRRELPCARCLYKERVVRGALSMSMERKE
jgi:hypothetical protein